MTEETGDNTQAGEEGSVLRRLLKARNNSRVSAGSAPAMPQAAPMTPARGAATAVSRAAERLYGLPVKPLQVTPGAATLAELAELLPDPALMTVVQGPGDAIGVVALCPASVTALIEMQTLGRVTNRPLAKRKLTTSDAMLCADFINMLMSGLEAEVSPLEGFEGFASFQYASHLDDPRPLLLMMEEGSYRTIAMKLSMGGQETREAHIFLALPRPRSAALPAPEASRDVNVVAETQNTTDKHRITDQKSAPKAQTDASVKGPTLTAAMQNAPVELAGILCRRSVSLAQLRTLGPGSMLSLPRISLRDARIETRQGQLIAQGKLGEADGCYAIRLHDPVAAMTAAPEQEDTTPIGQASPAKGAWSAMPSSVAEAASGKDGPDLSAANLAFSKSDQGKTPQSNTSEPPIEDLSDPDSFRAGPASDSSMKTAAKPA